MNLFVYNLLKLEIIWLIYDFFLYFIYRIYFWLYIGWKFLCCFCMRKKYLKLVEERCCMIFCCLYLGLFCF